MTKYLSNNYPIIDLHKKPSANSEVVTQMLYGESFSIFKKIIDGLKSRSKKMDIKVLLKTKIFLNL